MYSSFARLSSCASAEYHGGLPSMPLWDTNQMSRKARCKFQFWRDARAKHSSSLVVQWLYDREAFVGQVRPRYTVSPRSESTVRLPQRGVRRRLHLSFCCCAGPSRSDSCGCEAAVFALPWFLSRNFTACEVLLSTTCLACNGCCLGCRKLAHRCS